MSRNSSGIYTLPDGNPVVSGTIIESVWANDTMEDVAEALTESLPRNGSAPMTGPLTLSANAITAPKQAVTKEYVDKFLLYSTGMPIGAILPFAGTLPSSGWLLCDGAEVSRTTYPGLFSTIGTIYGTPSSSSVFKLPDLRDEFIRGLSATRPLGDKQASSFQTHLHVMPQTLHTHAATTDSVNHNHTMDIDTWNAGGGTGTIELGNAGDFGGLTGAATGVFTATNALSNRPQGTSGGGSFSTLGVDVPSHSHHIQASTDNASLSTTTTIAPAYIGITGTEYAGGTETRPQNIGMNYYIKAFEDSVADVAVGDGQRYLGFFDASPNSLPQVIYPSFVYLSGDTYQISVGGDLLVYDPATQVGSTVTVVPGDYITWVAATDPATVVEGWYLTAAGVHGQIAAINVTFMPGGTVGSKNVQDAILEVAAEATASGTAAGTASTQFGGIEATNVQAALEEIYNESARADSGTAGGTSITIISGLDATNVQAALEELQAEKVGKTGDTKSAQMPNGTTAERDASPVRASARYNIELGMWEFWNGSTWLSMGINTPASQVIVIPIGNISVNNVQAALQELDTEKVAKTGDTMTGALIVNSTITASGDITAFSDERLKKEWDHLPDDFVQRLSTVVMGTFTRIDSGTRQVGVSAQSLEKLLPEAVRVGEDGMLSVAYGNAALTACIALAKEVEMLKAKVAQLEGLL